MRRNGEGRAFERVLIIMFENQYRSYVLENPYMRRLAQQGIELRNSYGVMHPSQTNYIASVAGELCNVTSDGAIEPPLGQRCIVDLVEEAGLTWKAYMESFSAGLHPWTPDLVPQDDFPYVTKHNPFASFASIRSNPRRWGCIEGEDGFWADVERGTLPEYAWFTPNMWSDGHYVTGTNEEPPSRAPILVDQLATWLEAFFGRLGFPGPDSRLPEGTLVVVTFDESDFDKAYDKGNKSAYDGPNQIYTVLLGDRVQPGVEDEAYNHYSLTRTIEENFDLGSLNKNDAACNWFQFLWGRRHIWRAPESTPIESGGAIAATVQGDALTVAATDSCRQVGLRTYRGGAWSESQALGVEAEALALATCDGCPTLVRVDRGGGIDARWLDGPRAAEAPVELANDGDPRLGLALCAFDEGRQLILAYADAEGRIRARLFSGAAWGPPVATGHRTCGGLTLVALGPTVLLVFEDPEAGLSAATYNTAPFNVVHVASNRYGGPYDDTTVHRWSPSSFPVAGYGAGPDPRTPGEPEPVLQTHPGRGPTAAASLQGVVHLVHRLDEGPQAVTETFSVSGLMTPKCPVSVRKYDETTTSNGFGTLAEAGWNPQSLLPDVELDAGGALAMCASDYEIFLLHRAGESGMVRLSRGELRVKES